MRDKTTLPYEDHELVSQYFDSEFYKENVDILTDLTDEALIEHYVVKGVGEGIDPVRWFSTSFYLTSNRDVAESGMNPFVHFLKFGSAEGRPALPFSSQSEIGKLQDMDEEELARSSYKEISELDSDVMEDGFTKFLEVSRLEHQDFKEVNRPRVSVIIPNYNHATYLSERIESILNQGFQDLEIIILDDNSKDDSHDVISSYVERYPDKITYIRNELNSGNVFSQWKLGYEMCRGDFIWICESDDTAEADFLELMVPAFDDLSVMLAFCRVQFIDAEGNELDGLDAYRERAEPGIWGADRSGPAASWFAGAFSVHNIIPNVGGCLIRRQIIDEGVWAEAQTYSILGDWFLYLQLSRGGKISYVAEATTYFRQHGNNTSVNSFKEEMYYREHSELATAVREVWSVTPDTTWRFYKQLNDQFSSNSELQHRNLLDLVSVDKMLSVNRHQEHVLIGFLGFHVGGGEYFPIYIANALVELGVQVSMLAIDSLSVHQDMYDLLDKRIAVYSSQDVRGLGADEFIKQTSVTLINSHHIGIEGLFFLENDLKSDIPFISTLHGTYEVSGVNEYNLSKLVRKVSHWIYTADKNISHLKRRSWCDTGRTKLPNATPIVSETHYISRDLLDISDNTFVFILVSRPVAEKGWQDAIDAFLSLRNEGEDIALLLVGESDYQLMLKREYGEEEGIYFLGYQDNMHGLMRNCDCCLLPTRFPGESYPLILIQALQCGLPCISTTIGEISSMLKTKDGYAGIILNHKDNNQFVTDLTEAMKNMLDEKIYFEAKNVAEHAGKTYSITTLAKRYEKVFSEAFDGKLNSISGDYVNDIESNIQETAVA